MWLTAGSLKRVLSSLLLASIFPAFFPAAAAMADEPDALRQKALVHLVRQDCGSCHGMTLQGGLGPALLPASLHGKPVESLIATIYAGRPGTPMPPWKQFMSEAEATWIVEKLMSEFPK